MMFLALLLALTVLAGIETSPPTRSTPRTKHESPGLLPALCSIGRWTRSARGTETPRSTGFWDEDGYARCATLDLPVELDCPTDCVSYNIADVRCTGLDVGSDLLIRTPSIGGSHGRPRVERV